MQLGKLGVWAGLDGMTAANALAFAQRTEKRGYGAFGLPKAAAATSSSMPPGCWPGLQGSSSPPASPISMRATPWRWRTRSAASTSSRATGFCSGSASRTSRWSPTCAATPMGGRCRPCAPTSRRCAPPLIKPRRPPSHHAPCSRHWGRRCLRSRAEMTDGAHPYCVTPEHTAEARRILGPRKLLCPELMVLLETDPAKARAAARTALSTYVQLENTPTTGGVSASPMTTWPEAGPIASSMATSPGAMRAPSASASSCSGTRALITSASSRSTRAARVRRSMSASSTCSRLQLHEFHRRMPCPAMH